VHMSLEVKQYLVKANMPAQGSGVRKRQQGLVDWPLHDIAITNIVWYMA